MAFDETPGSATANSFLSVERADELASEHPYATAWLAIITPERKQSLLIASTYRLNSALCLSGTPLNADQALRLPRTGLLNENGYEYPPNLIPLPVELATFELANMLATANVFAESEAEVQGLKRLKAGPVELEWRDREKGAEGGMSSYRVLPENVKVLLPSEWLCENRVGDGTFLFQVS